MRTLVVFSSSESESSSPSLSGVAHCHSLGVLHQKFWFNEEITKKIFKLLTSLLNEFKKFSAALIRIEQETKARQERDREAYMQYQYKPKMPIFGEGSLKMVSGAYYIPKSKKLNPLGEDAYFICDEKQTIGVADGIGGWAKKVKMNHNQCMMKIYESQSMNHSSTVDTSCPFTFVKEAVTIFGEKLLTGELYSSLKPFSTPKQ
ncbi:putative protein phosphatase 2C 80 [Camellia lanceoleosa]|uniref:Uncharacterized protein n=1 Tax=Camellia lanceoleosa TaxID=1840588 RepID=A0ACC0FK00_9ERIC|nr:putative protein phosphatase 2C 80 [Camellia lanceoleosa]